MDHGKTPLSKFAAVDKNVAIESSANHKTQQIAIGRPHLIETEATENRRFRWLAGIRLGRRGSGVQIAPPRPNLSLI
jgi:hypothetical protein